MTTVLTIAGFDPSGGAGILADARVINAFGCQAVGAATSITFQDSRRVFGVSHQKGDVVASQIGPLFEDFSIDAVKIGLLPTRDVVESVVDALLTVGATRIVVDPVLKSSSGFDLAEDDVAAALVELLFPIAEIVTPNLIEAERLAGIRARRDTSFAHRMEVAAERLHHWGAKAVLVTGGDDKGPDAVDLLLHDRGTVLHYLPRVKGSTSHGTGCALSSALACLIAQDIAVADALPTAKRYVQEAIRTGMSTPGGGRLLNPFLTPSIPSPP